jgi:hypothetical protein
MKKTSTIVMALFLTILISSCASTMKFTSSPVVPGAEGKAKIKKDKNDNYIVTVDVVNLADSKKLSPPKNTYVVWMETEGNQAKNIGQIQPSTGLLSKAWKGELKATSTSKPTRIFITAEDDGNVQNPGMQTVLMTN